MVAGVPLFFSWVMIAAAPSVPIIFVARFISALAICSTHPSMGVFVSEIRKSFYNWQWCWIQFTLKGGQNWMYTFTIWSIIGRVTFNSDFTFHDHWRFPYELQSPNRFLPSSQSLKLGKPSNFKITLMQTCKMLKMQSSGLEGQSWGDAFDIPSSWNYQGLPPWIPVWLENNFLDMLRRLPPSLL